MEPERVGVPWNQFENGQLLDEIRAGCSIEEIAGRHQRTTGAITSRITRLMGVPKQPSGSEQELLAWVLAELGSDGGWPAAGPHGKECDWSAVTNPHFTAEQLHNESEKIRHDCAELLEAGLSKLHDNRHLDIMRKRLGFAGEFMAFGAIGIQYGLSRERIRQLQSSALARLTPRPADGSGRCWDHVTGVLRNALCRPPEETLAPDLVLDFIELATPLAAPDVATQVVARLCGYSKALADDLVSEVRDLSRSRAAAMEALLRAEKEQGRLNARLQPIITTAAWPPSLDTESARERFAPCRAPGTSGELSHSGTWYSTKLNREVGYDSKVELRVIQLLDMSDLVDWNCEQPFAIPYRLYGRTTTTIPTSRSTCVTDDA